MVLDILAAIGLKETGKYVAKDVLLPLLQGSLEDYTKDFFKGCIADAAGLANQAPVQKALGAALKAFVELIEAELEFQGCSGAEIRDFYEVPLREFMKDKDVKATLGKAFEPDCRTIDAEVLALRWQTLDLRPLPEEFDWPQIGKQYVRAVKGILRSSDELRDLLKLHNQEAMRRGVEELVGIPPDFDLQKYQETLREQYGNLKLESLDTSAYAYNDLKLWRMFIPQDVRTCQEFNPKVYEIPKEMFKDLQQWGELGALALEARQIENYRRTYVEQPIQNVLEVVGRTAGVGQRSRPVADCAVVLGDPGSGKSTLLQYVALQWAEQPIRDLKELAQRPLPLLIELRKYARDRNDKKCSSMVEYLHQGDIACRLNQRRLHEVLLAGDAIALFDGIDEVFDPNLRDVVVTDIHRFTNDYPQVQVVVTSRWLGYKAQTLRDAGFQHYMLQDLTDEQIGEFIARWHDQTFPEGADKVRKRERLHKAIRESKAIRELAGNPLLLTMMAILNRNQELPRDRPELYNQASRVLLHQWDVERNLIEQKLDPVTIDYRDKQAMLRKVAYHMQSGQVGLAGNIISAQDLEAILTNYLKAIDVDQPRDVARRMIRQLRERNFILCYLGADNYAFVHRTFLEFFAAWAFVWEFKETQTLSFEVLRDQTFGANWQKEIWREVLRLIAGMLEPIFAGQLLEFLINQNSRKYNFENLFLAADCLTEIRKQNEIHLVSKRLLHEILTLTNKSRPSRAEFGRVRFKKEFDIQSKAVSKICGTWNESDHLFLWLKDFVQQTCDHREIPKLITAMQELSNRFRDNPEALFILESIAKSKTKDESLRIAALKELSRHHKNDENGNRVLKILKYIIQEDEGWMLRQAALQNLAQYHELDSEIRVILKHLAQEDDNRHVRETAIQETAQHFKDIPETIIWLKNFAQGDEINSIRRVAICSIASNFKDDPKVFTWLKLRAQEDEDWTVRMASLKEAVSYFEDDSETIDWLETCLQSDENSEVCKAAFHELINRKRNCPDIFPWIVNCSQSDKWEIREVALRELSRRWKNEPYTFTILKSSALDDKDLRVRKNAMEELVQKWKSEPDVFNLLKDQMREDKDWEVRKAAVQYLARGWRNEQNLLSILKIRAREDSDSDVRQAILCEVARGWNDDLGSFEFWCDISFRDPFEREYSFQDNPRQTALNLLVQQYSDHPKTLELLRDRAQNDNDEQLREWAAEQLKKL